MIPNTKIMILVLKRYSKLLELKSKGSEKRESHFVTIMQTNFRFE